MNDVCQFLSSESVHSYRDVVNRRTNGRAEDRSMIEKLAESAGVELHLMSNETEQGVQVRTVFLFFFLVFKYIHILLCGRVSIGSFRGAILFRAG